MMERVQAIVKNLLVGIVLVTVGFALGKEMTLRSVRKASPEAPSPKSEAARQEKLIVHYFHATVRCVTCNTMEKLTHELLTARFAAELADGRIEWKVVDFQEEEALAQRYEVISSGVLLARVRDGKDVAVERLDETWTLVNDPPAFSAYVEAGIRKQLGDLGKAEQGGSPQ